MAQAFKSAIFKSWRQEGGFAPFLDRTERIEGVCDGRAKGQQRGGANGAVQGGNNAAAQSGLTRVRGAECAQGIMRALRDGLRGHARAILATSLLHILTHLYLVDDRRQDGHDAGVSRRGVVPPSTPLGALIERAQTTCHSGRAHSLTP